jgi:glucose-1-phosphate adenylyltransferase
MQQVLTLILGGGRGARFFPLTKHRSEPAVPIAGKYRLIDIPISNCLNSGLNRIYVLTQFLSVSLHRHIANAYKFDPFSRGFVEVLAAQQTNEAADWYQGTADAVRQNIRYLQDGNDRETLLLSGDQLYRMDFGRLVQSHRDTGADVTIAAVPVPRGQVADLGILRLADDLRVLNLVEKPHSDAELAPLRTPPEWLERRGVAARGREYLANMGIYVITRQVLLDLLAANPTGNDLVHDLLLPNLAARRMRAYLFDGYWQDLGTVKSYYEANLALAGDDPPFDFFTAEGVIYTRMRDLPATRISGARLEQCLVSDGCRVQPGSRLQRCVLGIRSILGRDVVVRDSVILGADRFETDADRGANRRRGVPDFGIGDGTVIERAIVDKDCRIGRRVRIVNPRQLAHADGDNYVIRSGIVVIPNGAVVPDEAVI